LDDALAEALRSEWAPFIASERTTPWLDLDVRQADHTIVTGRVMRPSLSGEVRSGAARFRSDEGEIDVDDSGLARVRLGRGDDRWRFGGAAARGRHRLGRSGLPADRPGRFR
jgi:hypothetical protein